MRIYRTISVEVQEIDEIVCNFCGETISKDKFHMFEDHIHIEKKWGYHSNYDGEEHVIDICKNCYEKLKKEMKISPNTPASDY